MLPYNTKVWRIHSKNWIFGGWVNEFRVPSLHDALEPICLEQDPVSWGPNRRLPISSSGRNGSNLAISGKARTGGKPPNVDTRG